MAGECRVRGQRWVEYQEIPEEGWGSGTKKATLIEKIQEKS